MAPSEKDLALESGAEADADYAGNDKLGAVELEETEASWTEEENKRLLRKIDWYLMPSMCGLGNACWRTLWYGMRYAC